MAMSPDAGNRGSGPTGRNGPCPCGSGQRYKRCCGRLGAHGAREAPSRDAATYVNRGNELARRGRFEEAEKDYRRALALEPGLAEAHRNLGTLLLETGRSSEALESCRQAAETRPYDADVELGRVEEAIACYRRALAIRPATVTAWHCLANLLAGLGRFDEALEAYRRAIELDPDGAVLHNNLGSLLRGCGRLEEAVACFNRSLELDPGFAQAQANLGLAQRLQGRTREARASCLRALELQPGFAPALVTLAESYADTGGFEDAERFFRQAIAADGGSAEAWAGLARLRKMTAQDSEWLEAARGVLARPLPARQEACLRYAIGKYFDDLGEFEHAFVNFRRANELTKSARPAYDPQGMTRTVNRILETEHEAWLARIRRAPQDARHESRRDPSPDSSSGPSGGSERVVLIVGMLRSGTTLAEQILASHPEVHGAGELPFWGVAAEAIRSAPDQVTRDSLLRSQAAEYLRVLDSKARDARRIVDKMPGNFLSLGLIHAGLPAARVIHLQRHPLDTCFSIYFQHLETALSYTNDLGDLARYYADYVRVMQHWRAIFPPGIILDVPYEALVGDPEGWSRKMIDHIGLPWDPRCLDFHATSRTVITASRWQVRQAITTSAVGRWKNYRAHAGPLLGLLSP